MGVDLSVYGNQKTLADYVGARQQQADQAQQLYQQGQLGQLDLASKKNLYATQIMSQVSASGDQNAYNMGLQHLQQAGIDTSAWAPDVQTGAQQAQAARMAASPYGALVNAATKLDTTANTANALNGKPGTTNFTDALLKTGLGMPGATKPPAVPPVQIAAAQQPGNPAQQTVANQDPVAESRAAIQAQQQQNGISPAQRPDLAQPPPQATAGLGANVQPQPQSGAQQQQQALAVLQRAQARAAQAAGTEPQASSVGTTTNQAAFDAMHKQWQEKFNQSLQNDPELAQAEAQAKTAGGEAGKLPLEAANSQEITDRLRQNVQKLLNINDATPDSSWASPETKAYFSKRLGSGADAGNVAQWNQIDQQQILSDYGQLVKSGAIKGSRQIFQALQTGSGIPVDEPRAARADLLHNLMAEIENKNITTQNVNANINGGQAQPYNAIPTRQDAPPLANGWSIKRVK